MVGYIPYLSMGALLLFPSKAVLPLGIIGSICLQRLTRNSG